MTSRYEAYMDNVSLSSLDSSICVLNIEYGDVETNVRTNSIAGRFGARVTKKDINKSTVTVIFEVHEYGTEERMEVLHKVRKWASGSVLKVSDRPSQQLSVVCEQYPSMNTRDWTAPLSVVFAAYNPPLWQDTTATTVTLSGTSGSTTKAIPGNVKGALVSVSATCSGSVSSIAFTVNGKTISLTGVDASNGDTISIGYDSENVLYIKKNSTSIMNKRTAGSVDDLTVDCGETATFSFESSGSVAVTFSVKGWWY